MKEWINVYSNDSNVVLYTRHDLKIVKFIADPAQVRGLERSWIYFCLHI